MKVLKQGIETLRNINPAINNMGKTHCMREGLGVSWELATLKNNQDIRINQKFNWEFPWDS